MTPRSFDPTIDSASVLALLDRLEQTRWPAHPAVEPWAAGSAHDYLRDLLADWSAFDFDAFSTELRNYPHHLIEIDGTTTHFVHVRSPHDSATPLILTHGWPSSFLEYLPVLDLLTERVSRRHPVDAGICILGLPRGVAELHSRIHRRSLETADGEPRIRQVPGVRHRHRCTRHGMVGGATPEKPARRSHDGECAQFGTRSIAIIRRW